MLSDLEQTARLKFDGHGSIDLYQMTDSQHRPAIEVSSLSRNVKKFLH